MKTILLILLMLIGSFIVAQEKQCFSYQFIGNYVFAEQMQFADGLLSIERVSLSKEDQTYKFGVIDKEGPDTTWSDPFTYRWAGNTVYILSNGEEYLEYSDKEGDTVFSLFEYISPKSGFVANKFVASYRYKSRDCLYYENKKEDNKISREWTTVICILDKEFKIPVYYEVAMYKFGKLSVKVIYYNTDIN